MTHPLPNPEIRFERYHVAQGGKRYVVEFFSGQPREVAVVVAGRRRLGTKPRTIWYGLANGAPVALTGRAAEVVAYITNPARAAANHAEVEDHATRSARLNAEAAERKARWEAMVAKNETAARVAEAAPDMLAALQVFLLSPETRAWLDQHDPMAVRQARAAVAKARGVNPASLAD